jgi:TusA-related sulfurtransferase
MTMKHRTAQISVMVALVIVLFCPPPQAADQPANVVGQHNEVQAVVERVESGVIFLKVPDDLQPRTLSLPKMERLGQEDLKPGDEVSLIIDENNVIIDAHKVSTPGHGHRVLKGRLEEAEASGKKIVLSTAGGRKALEVDPAAVSKVAGLKKGAELRVELDEANTVIDIHQEN